MSDSRLKKAEEVLFALLDLPVDQRLQALTVMSGEDLELREEVASLLAQMDSVGSFLESPALGTAITDIPIDSIPSLEEVEDLAGQAIGAYRLDRRVASGGMGTVYSASRVDGQYTQRVAIKLVKRGMDSDEVVRRFKVERQALAGLTHPNIARLLDGGVWSNGRPYLVMEFVDGLVIDEYCDARTLGLLGRLTLFRMVCDAVKYAHQHLVVHRDLKPRNVLVTPEGEPKLLDFGIAKVLSRGETGTMGRTTRREEQRLTPEYASPEQLGGEAVTTASDVYSLGVILYELLTGRRPYNVPTGSSEAIARFVQMQAPTPPSVAVVQDVTPSMVALMGLPAAGTASAGDLARVRDATPEKLSRKLRGDLDTIVLAAMHRDPLRRYSTVEALIADIDRFLDGRPVVARKDTFRYRAGKFVRRNTAGVATAACAVLLTVAGVVMIVQERNAAVASREEAYVARDQAEAIVGFLERMLKGADPSGGGQPEVKLKDLLRPAERQARIEFQRRPVLLAALLGSLARSHLALGAHGEAERLMLEAMTLRKEYLPPGHHDLAESEFDLSELRFEQGGRNDDALAHARAAYEMHFALRGAENLDTARALNNLASILRRMDRLDEALEAQDKSLSIRRAVAEEAARLHPEELQPWLDVAESLNNKANILRTRALGLSASGQGPERERLLDATEELVRESLSLRERFLAADHPSVLQSQMNLALLYTQRNTEPKREAARLLYERAIPRAREVYAEDWRALSKSLRNYGYLRHKMRDWKEAEVLLREAVSLHGGSADAHDPVLLQMRAILGGSCLRIAASEPDYFEKAYEQLIAIANAESAVFKSRDGVYKKAWAGVMQDLATACEGLGRKEEASRWRADYDRFGITIDE